VNGGTSKPSFTGRLTALIAPQPQRRKMRGTVDKKKNTESKETGGAYLLPSGPSLLPSMAVGAEALWREEPK